MFTPNRRFNTGLILTSTYSHCTHHTAIITECITDLLSLQPSAISVEDWAIVEQDDTVAQIPSISSNAARAPSTTKCASVGIGYQFHRLNIGTLSNLTDVVIEVTSGWKL